MCDQRLTTKVEITVVDGTLHLEAWVQSNIFNKIITHGLTPYEVKLDSGGVIFAIARSMSRDQLNGLIIMFGHAPIE